MSKKDEQVLRRFKTVLWPKAYSTQDVELLDRLLHDSFQLIDADGNRSTKQEELAYVRDNAWDVGEFEYRIERLDIYGRFAIVSGEGVAAAFSYRSTNALIKDDGKWRAVASHVSGVQTRDGGDAD